LFNAQLFPATYAKKFIFSALRNHEKPRKAQQSLTKPNKA
jgi:hypothetical protein